VQVSLKLPDIVKGFINELAGNVLLHCDQTDRD
jgi:hypothetical protein